MWTKLLAKQSSKLRCSAFHSFYSNMFFAYHQRKKKKDGNLIIVLYYSAIRRTTKWPFLRHTSNCLLGFFFALTLLRRAWAATPRRSSGPCAWKSSACGGLPLRPPGSAARRGIPGTGRARQGGPRCGRVDLPRKPTVGEGGGVVHKITIF